MLATLLNWFYLFIDNFIFYTMYHDDTLNSAFLAPPYLPAAPHLTSQYLPLLLLKLTVTTKQHLVCIAQENQVATD